MIAVRRTALRAYNIRVTLGIHDTALVAVQMSQVISVIQAAALPPDVPVVIIPRKRRHALANCFDRVEVKHDKPPVLLCTVFSR